MDWGEQRRKWQHWPEKARLLGEKDPQDGT